MTASRRHAAIMDVGIVGYARIVEGLRNAGLPEK